MPLWISRKGMIFIGKTCTEVWRSSKFYVLLLRYYSRRSEKEESREE